MSKGLTSPGITWKHVMLWVIVIWILASLVGGEKLKVGSFRLTIPGCSMNTEDVERDVPGLPLNPEKGSTKKSL